MADGSELPCQVLRFLGANRCVVRLTDTGAVISVTLASPVDAARAAFVTPLSPADAFVRLGEFKTDWFEGCTLFGMGRPPPVVYPTQRVHKKRKR